MRQWSAGGHRQSGSANCPEKCSPPPPPRARLAMQGILCGLQTPSWFPGRACLWADGETTQTDVTRTASTAWLHACSHGNAPAYFVVASLSKQGALPGVGGALSAVLVLPSGSWRWVGDERQIEPCHSTRAAQTAARTYDQPRCAVAFRCARHAACQHSRQAVPAPTPALLCHPPTMPDRCSPQSRASVAPVAVHGRSPRPPDSPTYPRRLFCRQGELKQLSAVQDWQRERLTGVDISSVSDGSPKPLPAEPVDDQRR